MAFYDFSIFIEIMNVKYRKTTNILTHIMFFTLNLIIGQFQKTRLVLCVLRSTESKFAMLRVGEREIIVRGSAPSIETGTFYDSILYYIL